MSKASFYASVHSHCPDLKVPPVPQTPEMKKRKQKMIIGIMIGIVACYSVILMIAAFLPQYVEQNYPVINLSLVGIIIR
jgi:archaellum biogenesis protein FlaJ (TadC family)